MGSFYESSINLGFTGLFLYNGTGGNELETHLKGRVHLTETFSFVRWQLEFWGKFPVDWTSLSG